jgi:poly(3-hydroxyalkanoate) synthetase
VIGEESVDLENITMPVLNIYATDDHLVPPAASRALKKYVGTKDYTEIEFPGGHIGIYVSGKAQQLIPPRSASGWPNDTDAPGPSHRTWSTCSRSVAEKAPPLAWQVKDGTALGERLR